ncbi:aminodeoxychorismate synthase, component I [Fictibacillus aquaticus]|uniref:Aminodeoxychorismate synthase, component I n=1 Tax=Fictibacillus aquaticus TaxID=2021314 RepID=A0A235F6V7_9BACL|nr:aminodeoxychorismate synthase, component I [Fictibacillus aquaticus]OYD57030.1 aminodeoxychorismate synthase, component I [Fictibacillus aquaticus]
MIGRNDWFNKFEQVSQHEEHRVLLESGRAGKYSIMGMNPFAVLEGKGNMLTIIDKQGTTQVEGPLLDSMKNWFADYISDPVHGLPEFAGGAIGYVSYDVAREIEKLPETAIDDLDMPDLFFYVFDDVFVYEHETETLWIIVNDRFGNELSANERLNDLVKRWTSCDADDLAEKQFIVKDDINPDELFVSMTEESFMEAVERIQEYIAAGDVFQVNLSVRQSKPLMTEPFSIYKELRRINPSPYMSYIQAPSFEIVSGSPELLVKKKGKTASTRPIAGTRPRGRTEEEDLELAETLINNEKERAEHVMLVDLERNDLGKVCAYGTVEVDEFMVIERYSHVMHIVSNVRGKLRDDVDAFDCLKATFPGGTITGAPKVRTMEIIEELEPVRRGLYTGSIGWIGYNGDMEMNIVIRTITAKEGIAHVQAGAGIVIDSEPAAEYKESLKKAEVLWRAKEESEMKAEYPRREMS